jgi:hypothetical protein
MVLEGVPTAQQPLILVVAVVLSTMEPPKELMEL